MTPVPIYWLWRAHLPEPLLIAAIDEAKTQPRIEGKTFEGSHAEVRSSNVSLNPSWHWLAGVLMNYAIHANEQAGWGYTLSKSDTLQYASYDEGQFYDWHQDTPLLSNNPFIRKLSIVCMLSEADNFTGGEFEFEAGKEPINLGRGDVLVFPSSLRHRVAPVMSGTRLSATCWVQGQNLR